MPNTLQSNTAAAGSSEAMANRVPRWLPPLLWTLLVAGILAFLALAAGADKTRAWKIFLVNFIFWSGTATGGVALGAIFQVAKARWPVVPKKMAAACAAYLPVSFLLFLVTWFGRQSIFPWAQNAPPLLASWLNLPSLVTRESLCLLLLYGLAMLFSHRLLRPDSSSSGTASPAGGLQKLAIVRLIVYAVVSTIFAWDFIMSLHPGWSSTLFGAFYFIGNIYAGLATVIAMTICASCSNKGAQAADHRLLYNLGKLLFSFSLLWTYLFWSQYLVIWYGNLPHETGFVLLRTAQQPWSTLAWVVLAMNFLIPFIVLLRRSSKKNPRILLSMTVVILIGMWLERFLLVAPSLTPAGGRWFGWQELVITAGFLASFALVYLTILQKIPMLKKTGV